MSMAYGAAVDDEVTTVLQALREANIKYAVWGAAACCFHGGRWLWNSQDYEIVIDDWFDGPRLRLAVDAITVGCSDSWVNDTTSTDHAWAVSRGDQPPPRRARRYRHRFHAVGLGVILIPGASSQAYSMHRDDLVSEEDEPLWIYPSLKNYVQGQLRLWSHERRNSALLELAEAAGSRRLSVQWANEVGLDVARERRPMLPNIPSEWEMFEEIARMALASSNRQRASTRSRARKAEKEVLRQAEAHTQAQTQDRATNTDQTVNP